REAGVLAKPFAIDGRRLSLLGIDAELRTFEDGRLYAAVHRAMRAREIAPPFVADDLDDRLSAATRAFIADPDGVHVSVSYQHVCLSPRSWFYASAFEAHARRLGAGDTVLDFLIAHAGPLERRPLIEARELGF